MRLWLKHFVTESGQLISSYFYGIPLTEILIWRLLLKLWFILLKTHKNIVWSSSNTTGVWAAII